MARKYHQGSVCYEADRKKYRAYVTVDGHKYSKRFDKKSDAIAWTQKTLLAVHEGSFIAPTAICTGEWLLHFLKTYKRSILKPTTYQRYVFTAMRAAPIASVPIQKLSPDRVQAFYNELSPNAAKKMHVLLHSAFQKACDLEMIRRNPINFVQPPKAVRKEIEIFTTEELHAILDALQGDKNLCRFYPIVLLAMNTGMRKGEVLGLRWCDVDLKQSTVFIRQQVQSLAQGDLIIDTPKTQAGKRKISIPRSMNAYLQGMCSALPEKPSGSQLVFRSRNLTPIRPDAISRMWKKVQAMAGVPYRSFHCLHHTHATLLLANGIHIIEVSRRLGHANVTQTLDTYGHSIPNYDQGIADEIEKIYNT